MSSKNLLFPNYRKRFKSSNDAENVEKKVTKSIIAHSRDPLKDLKNVHAENKELKPVKASSSFKKEIKKVYFVARSNSTSETERKTYRHLASSNITKRRAIEESEVFVPAEEHFINFVYKGSQTEIKDDSNRRKLEAAQNAPVIPARKLTLVRRSIRKRRQTTDIPDVCTNSLYDDEYGLTNFGYLLTKEKKHIFKIEYLKKYIDVNYRYSVVNWLVYVQQALDISQQAFFATVRMFDHIVIALQVPPPMYTIAAVTCLWIEHKFFDTCYIGTSKLFAVCCEKFSIMEFKLMEEKILKTLNYNVNYSEPESFLFYYLNEFHVTSDKEIRNCSMFLLELTTLLLDFSAMAPSTLAALSFFLCLKKLDCNSDAFLDFVREHLQEVDVFEKCFARIDRMLKEILKCKSVSGEVIAKYSVEEKSNVAKKFCAC